ncbi:hypothetical protein NDU88_004338, partial [Pleurodeles waltl]
KSSLWKRTYGDRNRKNKLGMSTLEAELAECDCLEKDGVESLDKLEGTRRRLKTQLEELLQMKIKKRWDFRGLLSGVSTVKIQHLQVGQGRGSPKRKRTI